MDGVGRGGVIVADASFDERVRGVLDAIHDPCSVAAGRPMSVLAMGLVLGWTLADDGTLIVEFCVTWPGCTMAPHFMIAAEDGLSALPGVRRVKTRVDAGYGWTPERMVGGAPKPSLDWNPAHPSG